jgi:spermidine/putrescine transport system substrate-binding protein
MILRWILAAVVGLAVSVGALAEGRAEGREKQLRVLMWSDYIDPEVVKAFEEQFGAKVTIDVYEETEAMLAKLQAGGGDAAYDLIVASDHAVPVLAKLGLIGKLDLSQIPNRKNVEERFVRPPFDPQGEYALPYQWGTVGIVYNKEKLPEAKPTWGMVFGEGGAAGRFLMLDSPRDTLGAALRAEGKSVNSREVGEVREAGIRVLKAKQDTKFVGFEGSVAAAKRVVTGQADLAMVYNGDALNAIREAGEDGTKYEYVVPEEGSIVWVDTMVVPVRAPNREVAHVFMNYLLDGEVGAKLSNYIQFATPNAAALPKVDAEAREDVRIYPPDAVVKKLEYLEDVGAATQLYDSVWTAVKAR